MTTFFLVAGFFVIVTGLYVWAQRRARAIREKAAAREQSAMALILAGGQIEDDAAAEPGEPAKPKIIGRLLEDDPAEKAAAAARHAAARKSESADKAHDLPLLEYGNTKSRSKSKHSSPQNGAHHASSSSAAEEMDPLDDLISQIMVHEPEPRPRVAPPAVTRQGKEKPAPAKRDAISPHVPLRELVLAWYESRGYRGSPASPAVWPIELVLRHRQDAARAYAFVVQNDHVSVDRITALIEQAREIGMMRVAVIAEAGYESAAKEIAKRRHVRLIDRSAMEAELAELELATAAKIIALARKRAPAESPAA